MTDILCFKQDVAKVAQDIDTIKATDTDGSIEDLTDFDALKGSVANSKLKYGTLEHNKWRLDGSYSVIDTSEPVVGYWSSGISNSNTTVFSEAPSVSITFKTPQTKYTMDGVTIIFADDEDYAAQITVEVATSKGLIYTLTFYPKSYIAICPFSNLPEPVTSDTDESIYASGDIKSVRIVIIRTNKPNRFARFAQILCGAAVRLDENSFYDLSLLEEISLPSDVIPINTLTFTVNADKEFIRTLKQCKYIDLYKNSAQFGSFYLQDIEKATIGKYTISCQDAIGLLEDSAFPNNLYLSTEENAVSVADIIDDILSGTDIRYEIDSILVNSQISIQFNSLSRREALAQVLLVSNAICRKLRNGSLWFGRLDTGDIKKDITDDLFDNYTITDNTSVLDLSMSNMSFVTGEEADVSNIKWYISEQTKDYILITVTDFPELISSENLLVRFAFTITFYQDIPNAGVSPVKPYRVKNAIFNVNNEYSSGFLLPQNFSSNSSGITIKIDTAAIERRKDIGGNRPENAIVGTGINVTDANWAIHPYLDFTTAKLTDTFLKVTAYTLTIDTGGDVSAVSNTNLPADLLNAESLSIPTVEIASLYINGSAELADGENKIIERLMSRYFQYSKEFSGKILTGDLTCGDTVSLNLQDIGAITGTITQLEYNLASKLIANAKIWLYYVED